MIFDILAAVTLVLMVGIPLVIAFDKARKNMESEDSEKGEK